MLQLRNKKAFYVPNNVFCGLAIMAVVTTGLICRFRVCAVHLRQAQRMLCNRTRMGQRLSDHSDKDLASFTWRMIWKSQTDRDSDAHRNDPYN